MTDWRELYQQGNWADLTDWWQHIENKAEAAAFHEQLCRDVPKVMCRNGMEEKLEHVRPDEAPKEWKAAAMILYLGELAAFVEGGPEPVSEDWLRYRSSIVENLRKLSRDEEVTKGDSALSRSAHANAALEMLASIEAVGSMMAGEIDPDGTNPEDRDWLAEALHEVASLAFNAGIHTRAAVGKSIEAHAVRGQKMVSSASAGGKARNQATQGKTRATLEKMEEYMAKGHSCARAADLANSDGYGSSAAANRKAYHRAMKK